MEIWDILDEKRNLTGKTHVRGEKMKLGEFHLVVHVWIRNSKNEYLISKRSAQKESAHLWESTGGSAVYGDDSLQTALKEVSEELGVKLNPKKGKLLFQFKRHYADGDDHLDVWIFDHDIELSDVTLQVEEVADAIWATKEQILEKHDRGEMVPSLNYLHNLFEQLKD